MILEHRFSTWRRQFDLVLDGVNLGLVARGGFNLDGLNLDGLNLDGFNLDSLTDRLGINYDDAYTGYTIVSN